MNAGGCSPVMSETGSMETESQTEKTLSIGRVARATGLSVHVIRAWERRYGIVAPQRTHKNRRMYSRSDIRLLNLCRQAVASGHSIARLAGLDADALQRLITPTHVPEAAGPIRMAGSTMDDHVVSCVEAIHRLNERQLRTALNAAMVSLPRLIFLNDVVAPVLKIVGERWASGSLKIIHEHLASSVIESYLLDALHSSAAADNAQRMVVATPSGQWCRLGALMAGITAADIGWQTFYFGASLPAEEILAAAACKHAGGVALSIAYRGDDAGMTRELDRLQKGLPVHVRLFVGGNASDAYRALIAAPRGRYVSDLKEFAAVLRDLDGRPETGPPSHDS
jgi:methanogenic corrinoid protein MtbC1